ncbi:MAG: CPBP family intramembrane metalloprotease [Planctomycetes bacterium]|nr:CPBP family intramembrane metalloprotease [Planctomycetota bacterium]
MSIFIGYAVSGILILSWLGWLSIRYFGSVKSGWALQTPFKPKWLLIIIAATIGLYAFNLMYVIISTALGIELQQQEVVTMVSQTESQAEILMAFLMVCGFGPIMEEIVYRACFYSALKKRFGVLLGIILSSLVFALMHQNLSSLVPIFMVGVTCAIIFEKTKTLMTSAIIHSFFNLLGLIAVYIGG